MFGIQSAWIVMIQSTVFFIYANKAILKKKWRACDLIFEKKILSYTLGYHNAYMYMIIIGSITTYIRAI